MYKNFQENVELELKTQNSIRYCKYGTPWRSNFKALELEMQNSLHTVNKLVNEHRISQEMYISKAFYYDNLYHNSKTRTRKTELLKMRILLLEYADNILNLNV